MITVYTDHIVETLYVITVYTDYMIDTLYYIGVNDRNKLHFIFPLTFPDF